MMLKRAIFSILLSTIFISPVWATDINSELSHEMAAISSQAPDLNPKVLLLALRAYHHARALGLDNRKILTIIDYTKPSVENRLYVVNLRNNTVPFDTLVAHGQNSGYNVPTNFSNQAGSLTSSVGVFLTENTYIGHDGYALRLRGLEKGVNDRAESRDIVMHGAWYVNPQFAHAYGRLGRSFGCPAISEKLARPVINTIKDGTIIFAYGDNSQWLYNSSFLHSNVLA